MDTSTTLLCNFNLISMLRFDRKLQNEHRGPYMHLWRTASQQVNEGWVKGHDGVAHVDCVILLVLHSIAPAERQMTCAEWKRMKYQWWHWWQTKDIDESKCKNTYVARTYSVLLASAMGEGPSLVGSSEILMASSMAARRPFPPSPLKAGPKHSGRRIRSLTTTLAFSSTLSPVQRHSTWLFTPQGLYVALDSSYFRLMQTSVCWKELENGREY